MTRYVAFLRGINVGGHRVTMDGLRGLFRALGFANVETFIASGNVIFEAPAGDPAAVEARVEAHLEGALGYAVETFLRTPAEVAAVAAFRPFPAAVADAEGHTLYVAFLRAALGGAAGRALPAFETPSDEFRVRGRELYWLRRGRMSDSKVSWPLLEKALGTRTTLRNVTTVRKLAALYPPA